ncbi:urease accessory protein UreD [Arthrobacter echini]|uniref:Urease accessory protein UreD n=1 Tax=Arthrobacter echini TaxID=1529066 RepID=A0A4S5E264_9MICC|nr:urease accessory protein UreD [Arthrobacter echini]THJ65464.1 urease accessory protein UreD [Arthrobacter echini]
MRSHAVLDIGSSQTTQGVTRSIIERMRSQGALVLRPTKEVLPGWSAQWNVPGTKPVMVRIVAGAAGPLGGDQLRLEVTVGKGAFLMLGAAAANLVLPGVHGEQSRSDVSITVAEGGTLIWNPGLQIAARNCHHTTLSTIDLAAGARLYAREEIALGRFGEEPGRFRQRMRVIRDGKPVYDQELAIGSGAPGWNSAAVTGNRRSLGTIVIVDPQRAALPQSQAMVADTAVMELSDEATLISSLAPDAIELGRRLDAAFNGLLADA